MTPARKFPVLIVGFNRPRLTEALFEAVVSIYRPEKIYFAVDGPRTGRAGEREKVEAVRRVADRFRDSVRVECLFQERNLGCAWGVPTGLSWMMEHETAGIVLEDDIEVTPAFFEYAGWALERFADDRRVMHVSGYQALPAAMFAGEAEVMINTLPHCWGWATWRRAWQAYDPDVIRASGREISRWLRNMVRDPRAVHYMRLAIAMTRQEKVAAWDYRWMLCIARANGLCLTPKVSLVRNVGVGEESTHMQHVSEAARVDLGKIDWQAERLVGEVSPELSERMHVLTHRVQSPLKLLRMQAGVWMPKRMFFTLMNLLRR